MPAAELTAADYARRSLAPNTLRAYRADWEDFLAWCRINGQPPLPAAPETVAAYLASLALTHGRAALRRRLAAITQAHKLRGIAWTPDPRVRRTLRGILRQHGTASRKAAALTTAEIRQLVATCDAGLSGTRDRALLLLGYAGALRRSELVAIERAHLSFTPEGLKLHIPRSKGDPEGEGSEIGILPGARSARPVRCARCRPGWR
jgi:site-specific recombinase XerD